MQMQITENTEVMRVRVFIPDNRADENDIHSNPLFLACEPCGQPLFMG
jgi:hypothetical protein